MRFKITPGNIKEFPRAFYSSECIECQAEIEEGDPVGWLIERPETRALADQHGPLCHTCIQTLGTPTLIEKATN